MSISVVAVVARVALAGRPPLDFFELIEVYFCFGEGILKLLANCNFLFPIGIDLPIRSHDIHDQFSLFLKSFIDFCLFKSFHQLMQMFFCFCTFLFHEVDMSKEALEGQSSIHDLGEFLFKRVGPGHGVGVLYNFITYWRQMKL